VKIKKEGIFMSKVDIISGFLGAGKTTLIKKLIKEAFVDEQVVLIENEFGEIGIDGSFLKEAGIEITEMNSGCICCSLVGDFEEALKQVVAQYHPDRIIIEPSGVGKLSDVIKAVQDVNSNEIELNSFITVVDSKKCRVYAKNFGEFFNNQIEYASTIILSRTQNITEMQLKECVDIIRQTNDKAHIITTNWDDIDGMTILNTIEDKNSLAEVLLKEEDICPECGHHHDHNHEHHHHDHEHCEHEHHHDHDHECCEGHHHHDHEHCEHEHHHEHDHECCGGHHHHHHHADEVFTSFGYETPLSFSKEKIENILNALSTNEFGTILRAKGILKSVDGWLEFDFVPEEYEVRDCHADYTGRICVIGTDLKEDKLKELFGE
jgi:G3E family GTPase